MKAPAKIVVVGLLVALGAVATYEARLIQRQRGELHALRLEVSAVEQEIAAARRARAEQEAELKVASSQLAELPATPAVPAAAPGQERRAEMQAWAARMARLKAVFEARPEQRIPEMKLLTDVDWLQLARRAEFDSDDALRTALAEVRSRARGKFSPALNAAVRKFATERGGVQPENITALAPYFAAPVDLAMLQRYEVARDDAPVRNATWIVREAAAVDADYDSRTAHQPNGGVRTTGAPFGWIDGFQDRMARARTAFQQKTGQANFTRPSELLPYFDPPLAPRHAELILKRERDGKL